MRVGKSIITVVAATTRRKEAARVGAGPGADHADLTVATHTLIESLCHMELCASLDASARHGCPKGSNSHLNSPSTRVDRNLLGGWKTTGWLSRASEAQTPQPCNTYDSCSKAQPATGSRLYLHQHTTRGITSAQTSSKTSSLYVSAQKHSRSFKLAFNGQTKR